MVQITFIRHAESVDNTRDVWAGWKESPLTNHGMKQAGALALAFAATPFTAIYCSDLQRTVSTAKAIHSAQSSHPAPIPLRPTELLKEQYFGVAEGKSYRTKRNKDMTYAEHFARGEFPIIHGRQERFPGGESKNDMAARARQFIDEVLMRYVLQEAEERENGARQDIHIAIVSHGLFIPEMIVWLWRKDQDKTVVNEADFRQKIRGMKNTAWTRIEFGTLEIQKAGSDNNQAQNCPKMFKFKLITSNCHYHLDKLSRQAGGLSRIAYDPAQKDIRSFFKGSK